MKPEEERVLGILATIFGAIALLGSWIPFINYLSFFIAIVAFILGIIGLIVNLKKRKTMAIIGTSLAIASVVLFFTTQILYANVYKEFNRSYREASSSMERDLTDDTIDSLPEDEEEDDTFTWTQEQFDALIEGDLDNKGKGGTNYKDIIKKHGLPDSEFDFTLGGYDTKKITYISIGEKIKTVTLTFAKQDNGQLLLVQKYAVGLGLEKNQQQRDSGTRISLLLAFS